MSNSDDPPHPIKKYMPEAVLPFFLEKPAKFIRENFVLPFRPAEKPVYYHRRFERVPTIDQCYTDDPICRYEAHYQFLRDKKVDQHILKILRRRVTECCVYYGDNCINKCEKEKKLYDENRLNFYIKYGEVGKNLDVMTYYMKQKHRMIWLRRRRESGDTEASYVD